ncbi:MAG: 50S ribosomal protein L24 [Bacteroidales bacterium]|jgi:large subunit ribosomal protein L24
MSKIYIKKGDTVMVIAGNSKGKKGTVLNVLTDQNKAIVEGVNVVSKHTKPNAKNTKGGIVKLEKPIHISNLMLIDGNGKPTRVGFKNDEKKDVKVRISKNTGEVIK